MVCKQTVEFHAGSKARLDGVPLDKNPYTNFSDYDDSRYARWRAGWHEAMPASAVGALITDERNAIRRAELRIVGHLQDLARAGNTVLVYPIEEGRTHILVWAPGSDREDVSEAVVSVQLASDVATSLLDDDDSGNIGEA